MPVHIVSSLECGHVLAPRVNYGHFNAQLVAEVLTLMCWPMQGRGGLLATSVKRSKFLADRRGCGKMGKSEAQAVAVHCAAHF